MRHQQQRSYPIEAVILKHSDLGEADRILTLFTPQKGKFHAVAKGSRRPISRKAGHLDLLTHSQLQMAQGRNLDIVTQAQSIENFLHLRDELWHTTCAFYLAEMVDRFIENDTQHPNVYRLLLEALRGLDSDALALQGQRAQEALSVEDEQSRAQLLTRYFEINLLSYIGYEPVFRVCAHCGSELQPEENGFTPSLGGALCPRCSHLWAQALSANALKVLRLLQRADDWQHVPRIRLTARLHAEIETAMHSLLRYHLERDLKSWSFLEMLRLDSRVREKN
ncbi:DNA repair protein RecO [Ktedonosporobacter rubrisoli]|uniref:DNA repair protein RecO n=1 Tax=Ktedonosporobacter rubrisoli TaxID=2509675 RepID=A0A4V0YZY7_KTERU|nr:DNA repair protein RecO [Ktedonosporobacter rubrisoli]QBD81361.1 DNA repair protein RecO [Ktedonosporobacter rubrisoli]